MNDPAQDPNQNQQPKKEIKVKPLPAISINDPRDGDANDANSPKVEQPPVQQPQQQQTQAQTQPLPEIKKQQSATSSTPPTPAPNPSATPSPPKDTQQEQELPVALQQPEDTVQITPLDGSKDSADDEPSEATDNLSNELSSEDNPDLDPAQSQSPSPENTESEEEPNEAPVPDQNQPANAVENEKSESQVLEVGDDADLDSIADQAEQQLKAADSMGANQDPDQMEQNNQQSAEVPDMSDNEATNVANDSQEVPQNVEDDLENNSNQEQDVSQPQPSPQQPAAPIGASLVETLVNEGSITQEQADQIESERLNTNQPVDVLLRQKNIVSEEVLTKAKSRLNGIPYVSISEQGASPEALALVPESVARRYQLFPFALHRDTNELLVAMVDPLDLAAIDFVKQKTGHSIKPHYARPSEIERTIAEKYAQSLSTEVNEALEETDQVVTEDEGLGDLSQLSGEVIRQAPIAKIVQTVLSFAVKSRASDVHFEPQETKTRVRYRIDGILSERLVLPKTVHDAVVSRIKILARLKIDEKRLPQDGRFTYRSSEGEVDLRVSTLPTVHGEKIVMRLLKKNETVPSLPDLGLDGVALHRLQEAIQVPHGIVLVTGPTGSGKTTTLYSVLNQLNTPKVNIMTLEDPVEYQMPGVNQVQANPQAGLTFSSGLRSFLRQDPNIIMVGEIRDTETVGLALQAALTGHLVFSTLHTSSAAGALPRLMDMEAEPFLLASTMTMVVAQRIARRINPDYREAYTPEAEVIDDIKKVLGPHFDQWIKKNNQDPQNIQLYRPASDKPEDEPDYKGRVGIFEVLKITPTIENMILQQKSTDDIEQKAIEEGMTLMKQDGYIKALEGVTTIEEVLRVART